MKQVYRSLLALFITLSISATALADGTNFGPFTVKQVKVGQISGYTKGYFVYLDSPANNNCTGVDDRMLYFPYDAPLAEAMYQTLMSAWLSGQKVALDYTCSTSGTPRAIITFVVAGQS